MDKKKWSIVVGRLDCPWLERAMCLHEENSTIYCSCDCPIKEPPNTVCPACGGKWIGDGDGVHQNEFCSKCFISRI